MRLRKLIVIIVVIFILGLSNFYRNSQSAPSPIFNYKIVGVLINISNDTYGLAIIDSNKTDSFVYVGKIINATRFTGDNCKIGETIKANLTYQYDEFYEWYSLFDVHKLSVVILSPTNNSEVHGIVKVTVRVRACHCGLLTSLYVDGVFINNGSLMDFKKINDIYYEFFCHLWNSSNFSNGTHKLEILGKHKHFSDNIFVFKNPIIISQINNNKIQDEINITVMILNNISNGFTSLFVNGRFINNGTFIETSGEYQIYHHIWDYSKVSEGLHNITVFGKDKEFWDTSLVYINETQPQNENSGKKEPIILPIIIIAIIIISSIIFMIVIKKVRTK